jgi:hypothetical protein
VTSAEFETFAKRLFTAFPDIWEWLTNTSPDPKGTQATWRDTLQTCSLQECLLVVDSWITGKRPFPKAYERAQIAMTIRSAVMWDRDAEKKKNATEVEAAKYVKRESYQALPGRPNTAGMGEEAYLLRMEMVAGKITLEELQERLRAKRAERLAGGV